MRIKTIIAFFFLGLIVIFNFSSCRKGAEDPAISFRSRISRISGTWNLVSSKTVVNENGVLYTEDFNGSVNFINNNGVTEVHGYEKKLTFNKDFTYMFETREEINSASGVSPTKEIKFYTEKGTWDLNSGEGGEKKGIKILIRMKSRVYTSIITNSGMGSSTTTDIENYNNNSFDYSLYLIKLSQNEMKIHKSHKEIVNSGSIIDSYEGNTDEKYIHK